MWCLVFWLTVTVIEALPKEKKQKEEKTAILGQCTVDLLPLVKGIYNINNLFREYVFSPRLNLNFLTIHLGSIETYPQLFEIFQQTYNVHLKHI